MAFNSQELFNKMLYLITHQFCDLEIEENKYFSLNLCLLKCKNKYLKYKTLFL